jgi:diacylglycerol kinase (ATP)
LIRRPTVHLSLIANVKSPAVVEELRTAVERLREAGHRVEPRLTFEQGDARRFASEAAAAGAELIVAAGGDGTLNEVANGVHEFVASGEAAEDQIRSGPRIGLIPLGTANDFAHNVGMPLEVEAALEVALHGRPIPIDVGLLNGQCFLNVSTGGFGAEATGGAPAALKRTLGTLAYLIEGIRRFAALEPTVARFATGDEVIYQGPFLLFAVGNSRRTGGGTELTPHARMEDALLDVCIIKEVSRVEFLGLLPDLRAGDHLEHPAVIYRQLCDLEVRADTALHVNADGEPRLEHVYRYSISRHPLVVMLPERRAEVRAE